MLPRLLVPGVHEIEEVVRIDERVHYGDAETRHAGCGRSACDINAREALRGYRVGVWILDTEALIRELCQVDPIDVRLVAVVSTAKFRQQRGAEVVAQVENRGDRIGCADGSFSDRISESRFADYFVIREIELRETPGIVGEVVIHAGVVRFAVITKWRIHHEVVQKARLIRQRNKGNKLLRDAMDTSGRNLII